jgi:NTP pyrophosphatase (non-canonical NTP hydrolase)
VSGRKTVQKPDPNTWQLRVANWVFRCFGWDIANDTLERSDRFLEEALELVQAANYDKQRAHALVEYVFNRPPGELRQEVGGVMVTLTALCNAHVIQLLDAGETELARISTEKMVLKIRAKQAAKPTGSALPIAVPEPAPRRRVRPFLWRLSERKKLRK